VLPEFAFVGRSNVGKSSLINLLTERRGLARVSGTPGKTQLLNFFLINGAWRLVDLPGYGFARVSKDKRFGFNEAVANYLSVREHLRWVFVLIDSRLEPQAIDLEFLQWLESTRVAYALIFTKADKQSATKSEAGIARFAQRLGEWRATPPPYFLSSAETGVGRSEIMRFIESAMADKTGGRAEVAART
jgi:GTP-binding protein